MEEPQYEYVFYTFICNDPNIKDCYVGSTRNFRKRKCQHKTDCFNEHRKSHNSRIYETIRANGGFDNWSMKPIDIKICSKLAARIHETKLMEERQANMNCMKAYVTEEQRKEQMKAHYEANKEQIASKRKARYDANKDEINAKQKAYYEANKEQRKAKYDANKDEINARRREIRALKKAEKNTTQSNLHTLEVHSSDSP
jgi:hypothetical protein